MAGNTQRTPKDLDAKSAPAYFNALLDKYEYLQGEQGASYVQVRGETGELVDLATATKQDLVKAVLDTLANKDYATQTTLAQIKAALTDGTQKVTVNSSAMEYYGATIATRPAANAVPVGAVYMAVNTQEMWQSNGVDWVVM